MVAEDYFVSAFNEMSDMLEGRDSLSIKRAVYLAEWAYYEGNLDYQNDFCNEIDRITAFVNLFRNYILFTPSVRFSFERAKLLLFWCKRQILWLN